MSGVDGVPLKVPLGVLQEAQEELDIIVPDYLTILQETQYEFSLEKWVITGLQGGYPPQSPAPCSPSGVPPSCPPYWQMFSSPQQSRLASRHNSDFWEPNPRQRSHSLNLAILRANFDAAATSEDNDDDDDDGKGPAEDGLTFSAGPLPSSSSSSSSSAQKAFIPNLLNPPACLSSLPHQRRKNLRQCSSSQHNQKTSSRLQRPPNTRANTVDRVPSIKHHKPTHMSLSPHSCSSPPTSTASHALGLPPTTLTPDSSLDLLSALSPDERELLEAITARGYPLHTAITALQKTGQQTPDQILSYLVACDRLCELGYDEDQVEEALEMFHNSETKAEEFLYLLSQFNEMGFQQNTIKEVLLVHENHRERALEELMKHVA
ncbi:uncharacterized protein ubap1lb [Diretmus argenteus]